MKFSRKMAVLVVCAFALAPLGTIACIANPLDEAGTGTSSQTSSSGAGGASGISGIDCGKDPSSGVTLCEGTTACPDAKIDPTNFPNCGFRTTTSSFDLECLCDGNQLCPIGIASTCADVSSLLANRTVADICNQTGVGTCLEVGGGATPASGTGGQTGASSTCDVGCAADCANVPTCLEACGC